MKNQRCHYCGNIVTDGKTYCNDDCMNKFYEFEKYTNKRAPIFGISIAASLVVTFIGMILTLIYSTLGVILVVLGAISLFTTIIIFPFATPETVQFIGVKKSIYLVRFIAILFIIAMVISILINI